MCINSRKVVSNGMQMPLSFHVFVLSFPGCGQTFVGDAGVITSPNHPDNHPLSLDCLYVIRVSNGSIVALAFSYFDLEPAESKSKMTFFCFCFLYYRYRAKKYVQEFIYSETVFFSVGPLTILFCLLLVKNSLWFYCSSFRMCLRPH